MEIVKVLIGFVLICVSGWLIWFFVPNYKFSDYQSKDQKSTVTCIHYDGQTYITSGKYNKRQIPENYIKPFYRGMNSGFEAMLYFEKDTAIIYASSGAFESVGVNDKIKVEVYNGIGTDIKFQEMLQDGTGKYNLIQPLPDSFRTISLMT